MSKQRGRQKSRGGTAGGGKSGNRQGKIQYNAGDEPTFIRQFKQRTGYQAPLTAEDKRRTLNDDDERPRDGDYRKDDEKPQIVQLTANDLSKEEVDMELAKVKEAEEETKCIDPTGRLLFRKPKEKVDEAETTPAKFDIVQIAANKSTKRKTPTSSKDLHSGTSSETKKKTKTQLLSFMDESGFDGDD